MLFHGLNFKPGFAMDFKTVIVRLIILSSVLSELSCQQPKLAPGQVHYTDKIFHSSDSLALNTSRQLAIRVIDSVYAAFPSISVRDKWKYYAFRSDLYRNGYTDTPDADSAFLYIDSSLELIERNSLEKKMAEEYAGSLQKKGEICISVNRLNDAYQFLFQSREISRRNGDSCTYGKITSLLGRVAYQKLQYAEAAELYKNAAALLAWCNKDREQYEQIQSCLNSAAFCYQGVALVDTSADDLLDSAFEYYNRAVNYIKENSDLSAAQPGFPAKALSVVYENMGRMFREKKDFTNARKYYLKSDSINKATSHDEVYAARLMMRLAKLSLLEGNIKEVDRLFPALQKAFLLEKDQNYKITWLWVLKDISHALGKINEEIIYQNRCHLLEDSVKNSGKKIADPRAEFERLENKSRAISLVNERRYRKTLGKIILIVTACVVTLLTVIFFREMKLRRLLMEKEKKEAGKLKEALFLQEMQRQEEQDEVIAKQRRQISADLHDELSSSLAALKYFVEDMKKKAPGNESKKLLEEIEGETGSIYQNARAYMHSLQKYTAAEQYDVVKFLDNISREFAARKLLYINQDIDEKNLRQQLTADQQDQFYHIIKESISNIIRNTQASRIDIRVQFREGNCCFMIRDDGAGIKKPASIYETGLTRVRKILNEIGGKLRVQPGNKGTTLNGYFPAK